MLKLEVFVKFQKMDTVDSSVEIFKLIISKFFFVSMDKYMYCSSIKNNSTDKFKCKREFQYDHFINTMHGTFNFTDQHYFDDPFRQFVLKLSI